MFLGITAYSFVFVVTGTDATDIASSDHSVVSSKVLFVICRDPSYSDSTSMLFVLLLWSIPHMFFLSSSGDFA